MAFPDGWLKRTEITALATKVESNESDFPYYLDMSLLPNTFWDNVQSDGGDIRITSDEAGTTRLALEIVSIDTTGKTGEIHFKDSTNSSTNKSYYLWHKTEGTESQPAVGEAFGRNAVWSDYSFVIHGKDATSTTVADSTGNGNTGTKNASDDPLEIDTVLGKAQETQSANKHIAFGQSGDLNLWGSGGTLFLLMKLNSFSGLSASNFTVPVWTGTSATGGRAWDLLQYGTDTHDTLNDKSLEFRTDGWSSGNNRWNTALNSINSTSVIYRVAIKYDSSSTSNNPTIFINGVSSSITQTQSTASGSFTSNNLFARVLDRGDTNGRTVDGWMKFFCGRKSVVSDGWLVTDANMFDDNSEFWSVGTTVDVGGGVRNSLFFGGGI